MWIADSGTFRALLDADDPVPQTCENLWLRAGGADPWEYDVILMDATSEMWTFKRDPRIKLPLDETKDGIRFLRPEVQLLHKARGVRPQDQRDFDAAVGLLDAESVSWLRWALSLTHPGHPWIRSPVTPSPLRTPRSANRSRGVRRSVGPSAAISSWVSQADPYAVVRASAWGWSVPVARAGRCYLWTSPLSHTTCLRIGSKELTGHAGLDRDGCRDR